MKDYKKYYYSNDFIRYFNVSDQMFSIEEIKDIICNKFKKFNKNYFYVKNKDLQFFGLDNLKYHYSKYGAKIRLSVLLNQIIKKFKIIDKPPNGNYYHYYDYPLENIKLYKK